MRLRRTAYRTVGHSHRTLVITAAYSLPQPLHFSFTSGVASRLTTDAISISSGRRRKTATVRTHQPVFQSSPPHDLSSPYQLRPKKSRPLFVLFLTTTRAPKSSKSLNDTYLGDVDMADTATEIDLDSVIDRLLEGELSFDSAPNTPADLFRPRHSARKSSRQACPAARVRDKVSVHKGERNFYQPAHPARVGSTHQDMWYVTRFYCMWDD